ncbi:hypothetical protein AB8U03_15395 [Clostridium sp. Mt-5]|uniref:Phage protein n=1 Tax=Clostridium moutaii TaxID=3240932 RepID=A0ABV4BS02_9CLOT
METNYTFTVTKDREVIFTKDKEQVRYSHERLVENIISSFKYSYDDADYYARHMEDICLIEYARAFKRRKNGTDTCNLKA